MTVFDPSELRALETELLAVTGKTHAATRAAYREGAERLAEQWRANATETAGEHGKHYPKSITWQEMISTNLTFEVGPEIGKPQGAMGRGFEYGSVNQPPHLDGNRATDKLGPVIELMVLNATKAIL